MVNEKCYSANSVTEYLGQITRIIEENENENCFFVYRGEPDKYPTPGMPAIFREEFLKKDPYFEKNILLEMKANKLSSGEEYLEMAIDAQHGGFPSRLLDVTYNCLIALYFACVSKPEREAQEKDKDSRVLVYKINRAYCPTAANVLENYKKILDNPYQALNETVFAGNHKFIDHFKINSRIIAQQGAFLMFQGMEWKQFPEWNTFIIDIPSMQKGSIADELERCFGITTSFVYPEIDYSIDRIKSKAKKIVSDEFSLENELRLCFENKVEEIDYSLRKASFLTEKREQTEAIRMIEKELQLWRENLKILVDSSNKDDFESPESVAERYNEVINSYKNMFNYYISSRIEPCIDELRWV